MRLPLLRTIVLSFLLISVLGCKKDNPIDTIPPAITIETPENNQEVFRAVGFIVKVLFRDNNLKDGTKTIISDSTGPYILRDIDFTPHPNGLDYSIGRMYPEKGTYTIKVDATDAVGNRTEKEIKTKVI